MPWPEYITLPFELVDKSTTDENEYLGPFNSLIYELFPTSERYQIAPQTYRIPGSIYFCFIYIVKWKTVPIFFIAINTNVAISVASERKMTDDVMRERFLDFGSTTSIPTLYGLSAMGTRFCVYEYTAANRKIAPPRISHDQPDFMTDIAPEERWNLDILEPPGEARLKEIAVHVKAMVADESLDE